MPLDTRNKRGSAIGLDTSGNRVFPNPSGTLGTAILRIHVGTKYAFAAGGGTYTLTASSGTFILTGVAADLQYTGAAVEITYAASIPKRSRFLLDWDAEYCIEQPYQSLNALTGQIATFSRAGTATMLDAAGNTVTAVHSQPRFEWADLNADGIKEATLSLGLNDRLRLDYGGLPAARTFYVDMVDKTVTGTANLSRIIEIGNSGATAYLNIRRSATGFDASHNNGSTTVTATVTVTVASGDRVQLRLVVAADGALTLAVSKNAAAETVGSATAANTLAAAWSQPRLSIGSDYAGTNRGSQAIHRIREYPGTQTLSFMQVG
jgi:hypothetical protein